MNLRKRLLRVARPVIPYAARIAPLPKPENSATDLYSRCIRPFDCVIEIGARTGAGTIALASLASQVYSFEPIKSSFKMLRANTKDMANIRIFNLAIGNQEVEREMNIANNAIFPNVSSFYKMEGFNYTRTVKVKCAKLDDLTFEAQPTALVMDCEGAEVDVIEGAPRTLQNIRTILSETHILSNGTSTLEPLRDILKKDYDLNSDYIDNEKMRWIVATKL